MNVKENKMYEYLLEHNYISENKKSNYQSELSIERAECIANKFNSLLQEEKERLINYLKDNIDALKKQEDSVEGLNLYECYALRFYEEMSERIKSGKYE